MLCLMGTIRNIVLGIYHLILGIILAFIPARWRLKDLTEETVLITGAGHGLGRLLSMKLAKCVSTLVLVDINEAGLATTLSEVSETLPSSARVVTYVCDVSDPEAVRNLAKQVKADVGSVTIIINNAGVVSGKRFMELTPSDVNRTFGVNVFSHYWINQAFLPDMMAINHGHIVTMASVASFCGIPRMADYSASKAAVYMLHECLAGELDAAGYTGIGLTAVCPFFINTGMFNGVATYLFPLLDQDYVADQILIALRTNQSIKIIPRLFYLIIWLKYTVPFKAYQGINKALNGHKMMESFKKNN